MILITMFKTKHHLLVFFQFYFDNKEYNTSSISKVTFRQQKTEQGGGKCSDISAFDNTDAPLDSEINLPFMSSSFFCWGTCMKEQAGGQKSLSSPSSLPRCLADTMQEIWPKDTQVPTPSKTNQTISPYSKQKDKWKLWSQGNTQKLNGKV